MATNDGSPDGDSPTKSRRKETPGRRFLLIGTTIAAALGIAAALYAANGSRLGEGDLLFGATIFAIAYLVTLVFRWSSQGKTPKEIAIPGGTTLTSPDQEDQTAVRQGLDELEEMTKRADSAEKTIETLTKQLGASNEQIKELAKENGRLSHENAALRGSMNPIDVREDAPAPRGNPDA